MKQLVLNLFEKGDYLYAVRRIESGVSYIEAGTAACDTYFICGKPTTAVISINGEFNEDNKNLFGSEHIAKEECLTRNKALLKEVTEAIKQYETV